MMKEFYLIAILLGTTAIGSVHAQNFDNYDVKNTESLQNSTGLDAALSTGGGITRDSIGRNNGTMMNNNAADMNAINPAAGNAKVTPENSQMQMPSQMNSMKPNTPQMPQDNSAMMTNQNPQATAMQPSEPNMQQMQNNANTVEGAQRPQVTMMPATQQEVIVEESVIGNTDTGATPEEMSKYLNGVN
jgi:hypothetical protein